MTKHKSFQDVRPIEVPPWVRTGYSLGFSLIGMGLLVLGLMGGQLMYNTTRGYHRLSLPGEYTLMLKKGNYLAVIDRTHPAPEMAPELSVSVEEANSGYVLPVTVGGGAIPLGKRLEPALFHFEALEGGPHRIRVLRPEGSGLEVEPVPALLLSESLAGNRDTLWMGGLVFFGLCAMGIGLIWWTRRRSKRFVKGLLKLSGNFV